MEEDLIIFILLLLLLYYFINTNLSTYKYYDPLIEKIKNTILPLDSRIANIEICASDKSFTEDKKVIYLCLIDKKTGNYYDFNWLTLIAIHEVAHLLSITIDNDHTSPEFIKNYSTLLNKAIEMKIYNPSNPPIGYDCNE